MRLPGPLGEDQSIDLQALSAFGHFGNGLAVLTGAHLVMALVKNFWQMPGPQEPGAPPGTAR